MYAHRALKPARIARRHLAYRAARLGLAFSMAACEQPTFPLPNGATPFEPPSHYAFWWSLTEQCSGRTGRYEDVRWYSVPTPYVGVQNGDTLAGEWFPVGNRIVVSQLGLKDPQLIRHEMLHALVNQSGHPRDAFYTRCNGYVSCVDECARDIGPIDTIPRPGAIAIDPKQLQITVALIPSIVSDSIDDGWFAVAVSVTNPFDHAVRVQLQTIANNPDYSIGMGWGFASGDPAVPHSYYDFGAQFRFDSDSIGFDAGETRNLVGDVWAPQYGLKPGSLNSVWGWFNTDTAQAVAFTFR